MLMNVYRNGAAWEDTSVTWNSAPSTSNAVNTTHSVVPGWNSFYLSGTVRYWVQERVGNHGVRIASAGANGLQVPFKGSNTTDPSLRPQLVVRYVPATRYGMDDLWTYTEHDYGGRNTSTTNISNGNLDFRHEGDPIEM